MHHLTINNQTYPLIPIKDFRAAHDLPPEFGAALFEPKDYTGLGRIDRAGAELNAVRQSVLAFMQSVTPPSDPAGWLEIMRAARDLFQRELIRINDHVGLRQPEIEFAVSGFGDVGEAVVWALLRAKATRTPVPPFAAVYGEWLANSVRLSQAVHTYSHRGEHWEVQMVNNAYGRVGMYIRAGDAVYCVADSSLACPAEGFMRALLDEVAAYVFAEQGG